MKNLKNQLLNLTKLALVMTIIFTIIYVISNAEPIVPVSTKFEIFTENFTSLPKNLPDYASINATEIYNLYKNNQMSADKAVFDLYSLACLRLSKLQGYATRSIGYAGFNALGIKGVVQTSSVMAQMKIGKPNGNANQPYQKIEKNIVMMSEIEGAGSIEKMVKAGVNFGERIYHDGQSVHYNRGTAPYINGDGGDAVWKDKLTSTTIEDYNRERRTYEDSEIRELSDIFVKQDEILPGMSQITEINHYGQKAYKVNFSLDCQKGENSSLYYDANNVKKQVGSLIKKLSFTKVNLELIIYSNGYVACWNGNKEYKALISIVIGTMEGLSELSSKQTYSYFPQDYQPKDYRSTMVLVA